MIKALHKISAFFGGAAAQAIEDENTATVEKLHYLQDASIATMQPHYSSTSIGYFLSILGLVKEDVDIKPPAHKAMELHSHHDHINHVKTFTLSGNTIEMIAVIKKPEGGAFQLDGLVVNERYGKTCIACGAEDISAECLNKFLACFQNAVQSLQKDPAGSKSDTEADLLENLKHANGMLNVERIIKGLENPALTVG